MSHSGRVIQSQLESLDDTDALALAWQDACCSTSTRKWGGRGKGGRGIQRRTIQPYHVMLDDVRLEYVGTTTARTTATTTNGTKHTTSNTSSETTTSCSNAGMNVGARLLLHNAILKLHTAGKVYALVGPNGCGKSSLLRRLTSGKIPGFPLHVSTLYISQDMDLEKDLSGSAMDWMRTQFHNYCENTVHAAGRAQLQTLEAEMDALEMDEYDNNTDQEAIVQRMEELAEAISNVEDDLMVTTDHQDDTNQMEEALQFMGMDLNMARNCPFSALTNGQRKKVSLALALLACMSASCDLLLLDEPTNSLDIPGLLQLRQLIHTVVSNGTPHGQQQRPTSVVFVSHDIDFINDVATDVIEFRNLSLRYFAGNYTNYCVQREQEDRCTGRQEILLDKKIDAMKQTLQNLKAQPKRGGAQKQARQVASHKKKIDRVLSLEEKTRWTTEPQIATKYKKKDDEPDKSIQFVFRNCSSQWNEPLVVAMEVGHTFKQASLVTDESKQIIPKTATVAALDTTEGLITITKKEGFLFDCVDLCIEEGGIYCILGESACGKSTLLKILAKQIEATEGKVLHALNLDVAFLDEEHVQNILHDDNACGLSSSTLTYLMNMFPKKTEQEIRAECTAFGLSPSQISINMSFLSGGERCRLSFAVAMLRRPQLLFLDSPTANLDAASVEALIYGLRLWNGTVVMVSHDVHFLRAIDAKCYVLVPSEGKLRRVEGGIDTYLRSFAAPK